jgi:hypothetical protein
MINKLTIEYYSVEYWQENWEELMNRVEDGESIGVENDEGHRAVMTPADEEILEMYVILNDEAS